MMVKILSEIERSMKKLINKNSILVRGKVIEQFNLGPSNCKGIFNLDFGESYC